LDTSIINIMGVAVREPLPPYEVMCIEVVEAEPEGHEHVAAIRTRDPDGGETRWPLDAVLAAVAAGERFVTPASEDDEPAPLRQATCPLCSAASLKTDPPEALGGVSHC
jgi:hypothetical protein